MMRGIVKGESVLRAWLRENVVEIFVLISLLLFVNASNYVYVKGWNISFFDSDDYMRLVRSWEWFSGGNFFDQVIARANSPFGGVMHWTRFYDLLWILPVRFALFFTDSVKSAVEIVGFVISPILTIFSVVLLLRISQFILKKRESFIAVALFIAHPYVISQTIFGRPDYHAFIILMILVYIYFVMKMIFEDFKNNVTCIWGAVSAAMCIWASPETLIPLMLSDAVLFLISFKKPNILSALYFKSMITACAVGVLLCTSGNDINYLLLISLSLTLLPYTTYNSRYASNAIMRNWHIVILVLWGLLIPSVGQAEYDQLSCVHVSLYIYMALFFCVNLFYTKSEMWCKIGCAALWGTVVGFAFLLIYPKFLFGMGADVCEYVKQIWLYKVAEMKSPLVGKINCSFIVSVLIIFIAICYKFKNIISKKTLLQENIVWFVFLAIGACYTVFGCIAYRMAPYAILFTCPIVVDFAINGKFFAKLSERCRMFSTVIAMMLVQFLPTYGANQYGWKPMETNREREFYKTVDEISPTPVTILASINVGSKILWFAKHKIVAAPYHRHTNGIIAAYEILRNDFNADVVKKYLKNTKTQYILISKPPAVEKNAKKSLAYYIAKLADERGTTENCPPEVLKWISKISILKNFPNEVIAKVNISALDE